MGEGDFHGIKALLQQACTLLFLLCDGLMASGTQLFLQHPRVNISRLADLVVQQSAFATAIKVLCVLWMGESKIAVQRFQMPNMAFRSLYF